METRLTSEGEHRIFVLIFNPGEEVITELSAFAIKEGVDLAEFNAIGGFEETTLGFYNLETGDFNEIPFHEGQVEVLSLSGEITREDGKPRVHGHTVLGRPDGTTLGGHLLRGVVRPILIVNLQELAHHHGVDHH